MTKMSIMSTLCITGKNCFLKNIKRDLQLKVLGGEIGRCCTRAEPEDSAPARKRVSDSALALKPRADVTRSPKQGYQWPH